MIEDQRTDFDIKVRVIKDGVTQVYSLFPDVDRGFKLTMNAGMVILPYSVVEIEIEPKDGWPE